MAMRRRYVVLLVPCAVGLAACTAILGSFEVEPSGGGPDASNLPDATTDSAFATDTGADDAVSDAGLTDAGPADASPDAPVLSEPCNFASDGGAIVVYPGDPCLFTKDGAPIPSAGTCKPGRWACVDLGGGQPKFAQCNNAVAPTAEVCSPVSATTFADENCNGTADEGCACKLGAQRPCGLGECSVGAIQTCIGLDGGTAGWGPCVGPGPQPRDCTSSRDNDCNGTPDRAESFCKCAGPGDVNPPLYDVDKVLTCGDFGSLNSCAKEDRKCIVSPDKTSAKWDLECRTGVLACGSTVDNDCNNVQDDRDLRCACRSTIGKQVPAHEVLVSFSPTTGIAGCGGSVTQANASSLCRPGCSPTTLQQWQSSAVPSNVTPTANYWLAEGNLRYATSTLSIGACAVGPAGILPTGWKECAEQGERQARVCTASTAADPFGNRCQPRCATTKALGGCGGVTTNTAATACSCP
jgi:hypothetical protein